MACLIENMGGRIIKRISAKLPQSIIIKKTQKNVY